MSEPAPLLAIADWRARVARDGFLSARLQVQIATRQEKVTKGGKPYYEFEIADPGGRETLRVWNDAPFYAACAPLAAGDWVELSGEFVAKPGFSPEPRTLTFRALSEHEIAVALNGTAERVARLEADFSFLQARVAAMEDPRLRELCRLFLDRHGPRFRRAAAARMNHHARRGGLLEHTAQMARAADAICGAYPTLHPDLLLAGVLFHDCGKMWENPTQENSMGIETNATGELLGHIVIGCELLNRLWNELRDRPEAREFWDPLQPPSDDVRRHLLHLIASHHGEYAFGSPVLPKTPEAIALNYIDGLDARLEMAAGAYANAAEIAPGVFERVRPLPGSMIRPLPRLALPSS